MATISEAALRQVLAGNADLAERNRDEADRLVPRLPGKPAPAGPSTPTDARDLPAREAWLDRLMTCPSWLGRRLSPEEELSLWVAAELRGLTRSGRLQAVWTRCPIEIRRGGRLAAMWQHLGRVVGVIPGAPDLVFCWATGSGWIELKTEAAQRDLLAAKKRRTYLRPVQRDFHHWCLRRGVQHETCRSVVEVKQALQRWGVLL